MTSPLSDRLRQRKLIQWSVGYLAGAWVLLQVLEFLRGQFDWPAPIVRAATVFVAIAFLAVLVLAWYHGDRGRQRVTAAEAMMLAVILIAAVAAATMVARRSGQGSTFAARGVASRDRSIAVLPFENMSADPENEYFSDGITEDILTNLAKVGSLRVVSRTSVMRYKGTDKLIPQIARELGVAHILEGSVRRVGNQVRITAQLIRAGQDEHLWADSYDRDVSDIFAVQTEIARAIADALRAKLTAEDQSHVAAGRTASVGAYDLHLRGRELLRGARDDEQLERAVVLFRRALEMDHRFALAEASLSEAQLRLGERDSAFAAARRAIALAPDLAEGYAAHAGAFRLGGQFREALIEARKAVELNPNNARAIREIGYMTGELGALDEALPWLKRAIALEPTTASLYLALGSVYQQLGSHENAETWCRQALLVDPGNVGAYYCFGLNALHQGNRKLATAWADSIARAEANFAEADLRWFLGDTRPFERWLESDSTRKKGYWSIRWAYVLQQRGRRADAGRALDEAEKLAHRRIAGGDQVRQPQYLLTVVNALRGDREKTLLSLRTYIDHGLRDPDELTLEPMYAAVQADPEFLRIIKEMKEHQAQMRARAQREGWW